MRATRDSHRNEPMPERRAGLDYRRRFPAEERAALRAGFVPRSQDDRWFVFEEDDWLYLHRSWTGHCIYALRLAGVEDGCEVLEAWVNRDPEQYGGTSESHDVAQLDRLLDRIIEHHTDPDDEGDI